MSEIGKMLDAALASVKEAGQALGQAGVGLATNAVETVKEAGEVLGQAGVALVVGVAGGVKEVVETKGPHGATELAQGLMNPGASAFVPYGPGQQSMGQDHGRGMSR